MPRCCVLLAAALLAGCSVRKFALNFVGDALAGAGTTFTSDDDVELVGEALPFGLKLYESLLAETPRHEGLLLATASGFTQYAHGFLIERSFALETTDIARARELRLRAANLARRGRAYALRGLELRHPGIAGRLAQDAEAALRATTARDIDFLYWAGASFGAALSADKSDFSLVAEIPVGGALMRRVLELDDGYGEGAAHEFMVSFEAARMGGGRGGGGIGGARAHYERALALSKGRRASVYLSLAESVLVDEQDLDGFRRQIDLALAVDPDAFPAQRLRNLIAHRRALLLRERIGDLFLEADLPTEDDA